MGLPKDAEADRKGAKRRPSQMFEAEDQTLTHTRSFRVFTRHSRRKNVFQASVPEKANQLLEKTSDAVTFAGDVELQS